jgi:neutral trehalase
VPSIPNGTNSYNLSINQPAGLQYMVTVWGASGIEYAGTTDVLSESKQGGG